MSCIEPKSNAGMEPRSPLRTPADRKNGKHVKANDIPPQGVYLPNNNYLAPHMKSPEYVQLSNAAAITLGIMGGRMHRTSCTRCLNLLLTYPEGCRANCAYCGLARHREADRDYADRNFIRVDWPAVPMAEIIDIVAKDPASSPFHRMCISMITHPRSEDDTFAVLKQWTDRIDPEAIPVSILSNPTTMTRADVQKTRDLGADIFTVALDAATPEVFDRTRGKGVQSPHKWSKYWEIMLDAKDIFGPQKFGAHIIVGMGETEREVLHLVQDIVDLDGHSHMFCFFPEEGSLMDHLPATPRDQWRRVQLARYLIDYRDVRVEQMKFNDAGQVENYGIADSVLSDIIEQGIAFRTSGCPGKFQDDISACDRPYGDSPPSNIASYPFQPEKKDIKKIRRQLDIPVRVELGSPGFMSKTFRIIDTGVREGRANVAFDAALIEERQAGNVPDTIRFLRFPPTALIGRHQDLSREVNLDFCADNGIGTVRRITGGGAIYLDEGQLGWELVFHRKSLGIAALPDLAREICNAAALGLSKLGVDAKFRPRNDIEVDGRKISGTGGFFDGDVLIYQGTVLIDMNAQQMINALHIPQSKLAKRELDSAAQRVVTLKELLGDDMPDIAAVQRALIDGFSEGLGISAAAGPITEREESLAKRHLIEEIGTDEFIREIDNPGDQNEVQAGTHVGPGGTIDAFVKLEGPTRKILQRVLISGDFFVTPPRVVYDLEAALVGTRLDEVNATIDTFFAAHDIDTLSVAAEDFQKAIANALEQGTRQHV